MPGTANKSIHRAIGKIRNLPAIPEVVSKVLSMTNEPDVALSDVSGIIEQDPGLSAKILRISNSPYFGMKQVVGTLKLASVILGVKEIRNIVLGVSAIECLRTPSTEILMNKYGYWKHSLLVAGMAKGLGVELKLNKEGEAFIAGLLHDIGKMVLWREMEGSYVALFKSADGHSEPLCKKEREAYDFNHADAAAVLASKWNMPESLADAIWCHHQAEDRYLRDSKDPQLSALVRIANEATRDNWDTTDNSTLVSCNDEEAWEILIEVGAPSEIADRRSLLEEKFNELKDLPAPML